MLDKLLENYKIILGSQSPRRQQFLKDLNIPFKIKTTNAKETYPQHLVASEITEFLAKQKAEFIGYNKNEILITSDTIVWHQDKALGKPLNTQEAFDTIKSLSGNSHQVITSVCIASQQKTNVFTVTTKVHFDALEDSEIHFYIKNYQPFDKAGSYGIQEWIGLIGISKIEGSYANVVGLPTNRLYKELKNFL